MGNIRFIKNTLLFTILNLEICVVLEKLLVETDAI